MPTATYTIEVDFDNDGSFATAGDDISADVLRITIARGFPDYVSHMAAVGRCTLLVDNDARAYSPVLDASVLPRRPVRVQMTFDAVTKTLFRGFLDYIEPTAGVGGDELATLVCVDAMALLQQEDIRVGLQENQRGDQLISTYVTAVYTPPATAYDTDLDTFPFAGEAWSEDLVAGTRRRRALVAIRDVMASNGGWFYIRRDGAAVFEHRHHRLLDQTAVATLDKTMVDLRYRKATASVFNRVEVKAHPRKVGGSNVVLWALDTDNTPRVRAGASVTYKVRFRDPDNPTVEVGGKTVADPEETTDYTMNATDGGGGADLTANFTVAATKYAGGADLLVTNTGASDGYITKLQIRGLMVSVATEPPVFSAADATSQTAYQKRTLTIDAVLQDDVNEAQDQADYLVGRHRDPLDEISGVAVEANESDALLAVARDLEVGDRVSLTEDQTGLSAFGAFVQAIRHEIDQGGEHRVSFDVERAEAGDYMVLDAGLLDVGRLAR